jgi:hypothetical protein
VASKDAGTPHLVDRNLAVYKDEGYSSRKLARIVVGRVVYYVFGIEYDGPSTHAPGLP